MKKIFLILMSIIILTLCMIIVSAARLPTVGGDSGTWGTILNTFLNVSHNGSGELRNDIVSTSQIIDGTITDADISDTTNLTLGQKITFTLGEAIDNIVNGWVRITGGLNVTGNITADYFFGNGSQLTGISSGGSPGGTEGAIQFYDGGSLGGNTSQFYINKTSGNVGIGTGSPGAKLEIVSGTGYELSFTTSVANIKSTHGLYISTESGNLNLGAGAADATHLVIESGGQVGINTTTPQNTLNVVGDANITGTSYFKNASFNGGWENDGVSISDGDIFAQTIYVYNITSLNVTKQNLTIIDNLTIGGHLFSSGTGNNYFMGNLGIGTGSPAAKLEIVGSDESVELIVKNTDSDASYYPSIGVINYQESNSGHPYMYQKNADGTDSSPSTLSAGDPVGTYIFYGHTGTDFRELSRISTITGPNFDDSNREGILQFKTANGTSSPVTRMIIDNAGNVGIGTTSPSEELYVNDTGGASYVQGIFEGSTGSGGIQLINDIGQIWEMQSVSNASGVIGNNFIIYDRTGASYSLVIQNGTGNIGIGTTSPSQKLDVVGAIQLSDNSGSNEAGTIRWTGTEFQAYNGTDWNTFGTTGGGASIWSQNESDIYYNNGNVGIGTGSPDYNLEIESASSPQLVLTDTTNTVQNRMSAGDNSVVIGSKSDHRLDIQTNATNRITILNTGNIGIGTTSPKSLLQLEYNSAEAQQYGFISSKDNMHISENAYWNGSHWLSHKGGSPSYVIQTVGSNDEAF